MTLALLVLFYSLANRFSGGGLGWRASFRGRPIYYAGLAAMVVGWFLMGWTGVFAGLVFLVWRLPGWYGAIDAGTDEGSRLRDGGVMALRALPFAFAYAIGGAIFPLELLDFGTVVWASIALAVFVAWSYDAAWHLLEPRPKDPVALAELATGAAWGVFFWVMR